jgi:hypothetical protein
MTKRFATLAAIVALSAATTVAAQAGSRTDPVQDQRENAITARLNQQQLQGGYVPETYQGMMPIPSPYPGMMQEQIAQPPEDTSDLSIIE